MHTYVPLRIRAYIAYVNLLESRSAVYDGGILKTTTVEGPYMLPNIEDYRASQKMYISSNLWKTS